MKNLKWLITIFLVCLCSLAYAQGYFNKKPVICGTVDQIIGTSKSYGEFPFLRLNGKSLLDDKSFVETQYFIALNKDTQSWSLIELAPSGMACSLAVGKGIELYGTFGGVQL
mgnify:FL=1